MAELTVYIGTYTRPAPYLGATNGEGLYVARFDTTDGSLREIDAVTGIENPSYLCVAADGGNVYAIWEVVEWQHGLVSSYRRDPSSGSLEFLGVQSTKGALACYVTVHPEHDLALVSNYLSGSVTVLPIGEDGALGEAVQVLQHEGSGPDPERQEGPHAHCVVIDPSGSFAFSADLGVDAIFGYRIEPNEPRLVPHTRLDLPPGSGPRHLVFGPHGDSAYVVNELNSTIAALRYDQEEGVMELGDVYPLLPEDFAGESHCADIQIHPSGNFVYASNRGHDSLAMFAVEAPGRLRPLGHRSTEGKTPRNFAITPDGRHVLVANQDSDTIVTIPVDLDTGQLGETVYRAEFPTPVSIEFAS